MCGSVVDIQSAMAENRQGKKEERRNHRGKIECLHLLRRAAIILVLVPVVVTVEVLVLVHQYWLVPQLVPELA